MCEWVSEQSFTPRQHSIGYMGDSFYRSKDPTNSIKVMKEMLQKRKKRTKTTKHTYPQTHIQCESKKSPPPLWFSDIF